MSARLAAFVAALLLVPAVAGATVFVIPLTQQVGLTTCGAGCEYMTLPFHLPGLPAVIHGATLRVTGTSTGGELMCDGSQGPTPTPWDNTIDGEMAANAPDFWDAFVQNLSGPFDLSIPFAAGNITGYPPVNWDFLADGAAEVTFYAGPSATVLGCYPVTTPTVTVTGVWILLDADIPVAARGASWGSVKAIYR